MGIVLPPIAPEPSLYGLLNSKTLVSEASDRWVSGFEQESTYCLADVSLIDACNASASASLFEKSGTGSAGETLPFTIHVEVNCSTLGGLRTDWVDRAYAAMDQCQQKAIELEFWEGRMARAANADDPGSNPNKYLGNGDAVDLTPTAGTPIKVRYGLALLEGALADAGCGGRGFVHTPRSIGSVLPIRDKDGDGVLSTTLGNYVIAGDGYTGVGDNGAAPSGSAQWIYATGPVFVRLDETQVYADEPKQYINTKTNDITVRADRAGAVTWDGCAHFKVLVDLSLDYA